MTTTTYENEINLGFYKVCFINEKGIRLIRGFDSPYEARKFVQKIRKSNRCTLVSYSGF